MYLNIYGRRREIHISIELMVYQATDLWSYGDYAIVIGEVFLEERQILEYLPIVAPTLFQEEHR